MYLHLMDVHEYIYDVDSALFGSGHVDIYDNAIRHTDSVIGVLLDYLAADGYLNNTIIAIGADHGEAFGERGYDGHAREVFRETTDAVHRVAAVQLEPGMRSAAHAQRGHLARCSLVSLELPGELDGARACRDRRHARAGRRPTRPFRDRRSSARTGVSRPCLQDHGRGARANTATCGSTPQARRACSIAATIRRDEGPLRRRAGGAQGAREAADDYLAKKPSWGDAPTRELGELGLNQLRALGYALPAAHAAQPRQKIPIRR
jgi:hypothetical protein